MDYLYYIRLFFAGRCPRKCMKVFHMSMMRRPLSRPSNLHHRQVFAKASKALPYGVRDFNLLTSLQSTIVPVSGLNLFCYKIVYCSEYPSAICLFDQNKLTNTCIQSSPFSSHWKKISDL